MIIFQKVVEAFLLPPGFFVTLFLLIGILQFKKSRNTAIFMIFLALCFYFFSSGLGALTLVLPLERSYEISIPKKIDAVVVLGGGIVKTPNGYQPSQSSIVRLLEGVRIAKDFDSFLIISGGMLPLLNQPPEAVVMRDLAISLGFPAEAIIIEPDAKTTFENAIFTSQICREKGFQNVVVVTSAIHMKRAIYSFSKARFTVHPCPTGYLYNHSRLGWSDYLPNRDALTANLWAIHEIIGILWYRFK